MSFNSRAEQVMAALAAIGIISRRPVYRSLHRMLGLPGFRTTDRIWRETISLPIYPDMTDEEARRVIRGVVAVLSRPGRRKGRRR
jgi:dTDP-4-amino-4,6-dideoxygalactose transaminase